MGGDYNFQKYELDLRRYFNLKNIRAVFAQRLHFGILSGGRDLLYEYFMVGGSDTIRGYDESAYFGTRMAMSNSELRFNITEGFTGVVFIDAGNTWLKSLRLQDFKVGVGTGIRFNIPGIGPIRLDYGYGLKTKEGQMHFSFGQMF